jgi:hypothetical protein
MAKNRNTQKNSIKKVPKGQVPGLPSRIYSKSLRFLPKRVWPRRLLLGFISLVILCIGTMYGIAQWYIHEHAHDPLVYGATFIPSYAEYFGLDAKDTMQAMIDDLHVKNFRLVSYWEDIEPSKGVFDFSKLDWQFEKASAAGAKISLAIGLRQPRWPECHMPSWIDTAQPEESWYPQLKEVMTKVIDRYKNNPALESYQLENEYFLKAFGQCNNFDRSRLVNEFNLVKSLDSQHTLIITRSNNGIGVPINAPTPDEFGVSVYKRVWDKTITHRYFEYPLPAWFYGFLGGAGEIVSGKNIIIHELQAESWLPDGQNMPTASLAEMNKSLDAKRLKQRFEYGKATGIKHIDLWGVEWWYFRKQKLHDPSLWNVAKDEFNKGNQGNAK